MKKIIKYLIAIFILINIVLLIKLPNIVEKTYIDRFQTLSGRRVETGSFTYNYLKNTINISDFKIYEDDGKTVFASFKELDVDVALRYLFEREFLVEEVTLKDPIINISYKGKKPNYESVIANIGKIKKGEASDGGASGFIKTYTIKNIKVNNLIINYEDKIVETENNITFKSPQIKYEDSRFEFSFESTLEGKSTLNFHLNYDEDGKISGNIRVQNLDLYDKLNDYVKELRLKNIRGMANFNIDYTYDLMNKKLETLGVVDLSNLNVESEEFGGLIKAKHLKVDVTEIYPLDNVFAFKNIEADSLKSDLRIVDKYIKSFNSMLKKGEKKNDIILTIDNLKGTNLDFILNNYSFDNMDVELKGFKDNGEKEFTLNASGVVDNRLKVDIESKNKFLKGFNFDKNSIITSGRIMLEGNDLKTIKKMLPKDRKWDLTSKKFKLGVDYSYNYPNLRLHNNLESQDLKLIGVAGIELLAFKKAKTDHVYEYNFDKSRYRVTGDVDTEYLKYIDTFGSIEGINLKLEKGDFTSNKKTIKFFKGERGIIDGEFGVLDLNRLVAEDVDVKKGEYFGKSVELGSLIFDDSKKERNFLAEDLNSTEMTVGTKVFSSDNLVVRKAKIYKGLYDGKENKKEIELPYINVKKSNIEEVSVEGYDRFKSKVSGSNITTDIGKTDLRVNTSYEDKVNVDFKGILKKDINLKVINDLKKLEVQGAVHAKDFDAKIFNEFTNKVRVLNGTTNIHLGIYYKDGLFKSENYISLKDTSVRIKGNKLSFETFNLKGKFEGNKDGYKYYSDQDATNLKLEGRSYKFFTKEVGISIIPSTKKSFNIDTINLRSPTLNIYLDEANDDMPDRNYKLDMKGFPVVNIGSFISNKGSVNYYFNDINYSVRNIELTLKNFTTESNKRFNGRLNVDLTGVGKGDAYFNSYFTKRNLLSINNLNLDGGIDIEGLNLLDFKKYIDSKISYEVLNGRVFSNSSISLKDSKFKGDNLIVIRDLQLGDKTEVKSRIPLRLAVSVLRDKNGDLPLDVPISGDFNNPNFRLRRVAFQVTEGILLKAVTSPLAILNKTFNFKTNEKIVDLKFNDLEGNLKDDEYNKLITLVKLLKENKEMSLGITLFSSDEERGKLGEKNIKKNNLNNKVYNLLFKRKKYLDDYFERVGVSERTRVEVSKLTRTSPIGEVDFILDKK